MATVAQGTRRPPIPFEVFHARNLFEAQALRPNRVLIVGLGAVGSQIADQLGRSGLSLVLIDRDHLERENCFRHAIPPRFIGKPKAFALARKLREELPASQAIHAVHVDVTELTAEQLVSAVVAAGDPSIIIGATGSDAIDAGLDMIARALRAPFIAPGVFEQGNIQLVGEIWVSPWHMPDRTGCACFTCGRRATDNDRGQLDAAQGSPTDVSLVATHTAAVIKGLLRPETHEGRRYLALLRRQRQIYAIRRRDHCEIPVRLASDARCSGCQSGST